MSTQIFFNGRMVRLPGVYSRVTSGVSNPPQDLSYGRVLIIDKDQSSTYGGGAGVAGTLAQGKNSIYPFDNAPDFRKFVGGGLLWDLVAPLFSPVSGGNGTPLLYYARALTTLSSALTLAWANGNISFRARQEGLRGNGFVADKTTATVTVTVTAAGAAASTLVVVVNGVTLGTFTSIGGQTPAQAAVILTAAINALTGTTGYTAISNGATVQIFAPNGLGSTANTYTSVVTPTGTATATISSATLLGGLTGDYITRGFGVTMSAGVVNTSAFLLKFWAGTHAGVDSVGDLYNGIPENQNPHDLLAQSVEFTTFAELITWATNDYNFNNYFELNTSLTTGVGPVVVGDLSATTGFRLFAGGTQSYSSTRVDEVLEAVKKLDYTYILSMDSGASATSLDNTKILAHIQSAAKYKKVMVVAGGDTASNQAQSLTAASTFNSSQCIVVHGGIKTRKVQGLGLKEKSALYNAAYVLGRISGLAPQTPITFKGLGYSAVRDEMSDLRREQFLQAGVLTTNFDSEIGFIVVDAGINTLQLNTNVVNSDGQSYLISVIAIASQLTKELEVNMKVDLLGNQSQGPNRATLSPSIVENWVKTFLRRKEATTTTDNLILSFKDISATVQQDAIFVSFKFEPNFEINKIFVTAIIIDPN